MSSSLTQLEPALKLLRDSKDESKFVGLLLICKALAPPPAPAAAAVPESAAPAAAASAASTRPTNVAAHAAASAASTPSAAPAASSPEVISIRVSEHISGLRSSVPGPDYGRDSDDDDENTDGDRPEGSAAADAYEDEDEEDEDSAPSTQSRAPNAKKKKPEPPVPAFDTDILQTIYDAVGYRFLARLLKTTRGDNALVSQRLGLNIVSTLCIHAPIAAHFEAVLPEIIAILHSTPMTEVDVIGDAARCMVAIAHASLAARRAFVPRNQSTLPSSSGAEEATGSGSGAGSASETEAEWRARANGIAVAAARLGVELPDATKLLLLRFIQLTLVSAHTHAAASLAGNSALSAEHVDIARVLVGVPSLLAAVARAFAAAQGEAKFDALCLLARLLEVDEQQRDVSDSGSASDAHDSGIARFHGKDAVDVNAAVSKADGSGDDDDEWVFPVRLALRDILFSRFGRAKAPYRCAVLKCCGAFLRRRRLHRTNGGQQWAVRPWGTPEQSALFTSGQFVQMLMKMVTVEVRVQLESHAIADDTADVLSAAFALVELAITFLTDDGNYDGSAESHAEADVGLASANSSSASSASHAWAALPSAVLLSLQRDFTELFGAVFIYLGDQRDDAAPPSPVALACVRALGAWLAEETGGGALRDRFVDVLPYLLEITDVGAALGGVGGGYVNDGVEGGSDDDDGKVDAAADSGHRSLMLEAAAQDALSYLLSGLGAVMADHADVCAIAVAHRVHSRALAMIVLASDEADAALKRGVASSSIASASAASSYLSVSAAAALSAAIATARVNLGEVAAAAVVVRAMLSAANADAARVLVCGPASSSSSSSMLQHVPTVYRLFVALGELSLSDSEIDAGVLRAANHCRAQLVALMLQMVIHCPAAANLSLPLRTLLWGQSLPAASAFVAIAHPPASASSSFWSGVVACLAQRAARREFDDAFLAAIEALLVDCSDGTGSPSSSFALPIAAAVAGGALVPALLHAAANIAASSGAVSDGADSDDDDDENEDEERAAIADLDALLATVLLSSAPASGIASSSTSGSGSGAVADAVARHVHVEMKLRPALARALPQTMARV